jgi:hypothetical protein
MKTTTTSKILKTLIVATLVTASCFSAFSQGRFSFGPEIGVPLGNFSNFTSVGIGAFGRYEAPIQSVPKLNWTAQLSLIDFFGKNIDGVKVSTFMLPVMGGIKYYANERFNGFYGSVDLGFVYVSEHSKVDLGNGQTISPSNSTSRIALAPGAGYEMGEWDFGVRFNLMGDFSYLNLRAAYTLPAMK